MQDEVLNKMKKTTNANPDNQAEQPVEQPTGAENNIYSAENNQAYYDATKPAKQTNYVESVAKNQNEETAKMNTGTGASAAVGTDYSWDTKGKKLAENAYQQKALEEKQNMLTQRQDMEKNAQQYQTKADMQKYTDNQTADKVGWTGGYVLDQERQREYMKQSIQAQLYGAMELQKYGYDTAMAAARLSYDANLLTYAQEYYNQAVQNSLNEAQLTGTYFSAEVKDMLGQYTIAEANLNDSSLSDEERTRAQKVKDTIDNWFSENNISRAGIKTLEAWNAEQSLELQWTNELWTQYNAALNAANASLEESGGNKFIMLDDNGNNMYDGTTVKLGDWSTLSGKDILQYIENDTTGQKKQQLYGYIDTQLAGESRAEFMKWAYSKGYVSKDKDGEYETSYVYRDLFGQYLGETDVFANFINNKLKGLDKEEEEKLAKELDGYQTDISFPDGTTATYVLRVVNKDTADKLLNNNEKSAESTGEKSSARLADTTYTYEEKDKLLVDLSNNKKFQELNDILEGMTEKDPDKWTVEDGWYNAFRGMAVSGGWGGTIMDEFAIDKEGNKQARDLIEAYLGTVRQEIGDNNLDVMEQIAEEYSKMSDADKKKYSQATLNNYKECAEFIKMLNKAEEAYEWYDDNDDGVLTWQHIGDSWANVGRRWSNMDSFGDFVGAVGSTFETVGTTVADAVIGTLNFSWIWGWFV